MRSLSYSSLPSLPQVPPRAARDRASKRIAYPPETSWVNKNERGPVLYIGAGTDLHPLVQFPNVKTFLYIDGLPANRFYQNENPVDPKHYSHSIKTMIAHMRAQLGYLGEDISMVVHRQRHSWRDWLSHSHTVEHMASLLKLKRRSRISNWPPASYSQPRPDAETIHFHFSTGQVIEFWFNVQDSDIAAMLSLHPERRALFNSCTTLLVHGWLPEESSLPKDRIRTVYHTRVFDRIRHYDWAPDTNFETVFHWNFCTPAEASDFLKWKGYVVPTGFWTFENKREEERVKQRASVQF